MRERTPDDEFEPCGGMDAGADGLTPADRELEATLAGLRPAAAAVHTPEAVFEAGRRAGERAARQAVGRQLFAWRAAAAAVLVVAGGAFVLRAEPQVVERVRVVEVRVPAVGGTPAVVTPSVQTPVSAPPDSGLPPDPPPAAPLGPRSLLALSRTVLNGGVDAMPTSTTGWAPALGVRGVVVP